MDAILYDKITSESARLMAAIQASGGGVYFSTVQTFVGDYTNDPITLTLGSVDKYYRRIYGT